MKKSTNILIGSIGFMFLFIIVWFILKFTTGNKIPFLNQLLWIATGLFIFSIVRFIWKVKSQVKDLKQQGIPAKAKITGIINEPYRVGKMSQIKLLLQLSDNAGQPFIAECIVYGTEEDPGEFFVGKVIDVLIDPNNGKNLSLNYNIGNNQSTAMSFYRNS